MNPKISIVIPVYNVEKYLRECLDSVRAQTFTDWECICVDDGSTDSSSAILDEYAAKDKRFTIIKREHSNAGACRNAGLDLARGEYLSFLDSDDVFAPKMLEVMFEVAIQNQAEVVSCNQNTYRDGNPMPPFYKNVNKRRIRVFDSPGKTENIYALWGGRAWDKLFRRDFVIKNVIKFQEIRSTNDMRFTYSCMALAARVVHIDCPLIAHRLNAASLEATRSKGALCMIEALKSYNSEMCRLGVFDRYERLGYYFKLWIVDIMFWYMDTIDTTEAFQTVHKAFYDICEYFCLSSLSREDFPDEEVFIRFDKIRGGCQPIESLRLHEQLLMSKIAELRPYKYFANSRDYKIGHMLLYPPRALKRLVRKILDLFT